MQLKDLKTEAERSFARHKLLDGNLESLAIATHLIQTPEVHTPLLSRNKYETLSAVINPNLVPTVNLIKSEPQLYFEDRYGQDDVPFPPPIVPKFNFIDLFAGIGGFRLAMQNQGGKCVFSSEWDKNAQKTYYHNYGEVPYGDITNIPAKDIPDHDLLCAGFPCQAFSIAGAKKGFEDTRGTLFFNVAEIIKAKQPKAIFLENVKGLVNHDKGRTLSKILSVLRDELDYYVPNPEILNAKKFGVPQNRERILS